MPATLGHPDREGSRPPNILYLTADQQKARATSVYGNGLVSCPFTEDLAAGGITFVNAHAVSTICTPSRASVMTGVHPLVHRVTCWQNKAPWNLPQLAELFAGGGYYTAAAGHYEMGRNLGRGWHEQADLWEVGELHDTLKFKYAHGRSDCGWSSGRLECGAEEGYSARLGNRAIRMIDNAVQSGAPFFMHVSFSDPHPPYFVPPPYDTLVDPAQVVLPDPGSSCGRPAWQVEALAQVNTAAAEPADLRKTTAVYYGMIAYVDAQMQHIRRALAERGLLESTWIIFGVDHGDFMGEKGLFEKCEVPYECLTRVPLIIAPPRDADEPRGQRVNGLVQTVDLYPTMLGLAGLAVPEYTQGKDLLSWVRDGTPAPLHERLFAQVGDYQGNLKNTFPGGTFEAGRRQSLVQAVRTEDFSYIADSQCGDEAYDLRTDPAELRNVLQRGEGAEPAWVGQMRRQREEWEEECLRLREQLGVIPGDRGFD